MIYDIVPFELLVRLTKNVYEQEWEPEPLYLEDYICDEDKSPIDRDKDLPIKRVIVIDI